MHGLVVARDWVPGAELPGTTPPRAAGATGVRLAQHHALPRRRGGAGQPARGRHHVRGLGGVPEQKPGLENQGVRPEAGWDPPRLASGARGEGSRRAGSPPLAVIAAPPPPPCHNRHRCCGREFRLLLTPQACRTLIESVLVFDLYIKNCVLALERQRGSGGSREEHGSLPADAGAGRSRGRWRHGGRRATAGHE